MTFSDQISGLRDRLLSPVCESYAGYKKDAISRRAGTRPEKRKHRIWEKDAEKGRALHSILPGGGTLVLGAREFKIGTFAKGRLQFERRGPAAGPRQIVGRVRFENGNSVAVRGVMRAEKNGPAVIDALRIGPAADVSDHEFFEIAAAPPRGERLV